MVKCHDCGDAYCKADFQRIHRKGTRQNHNYEEFSLGSQVCVECEERIAIKYCISCKDALCNECFRDIHKKKFAKAHDFRMLQDEADGVAVAAEFGEVGWGQ